MGRSFSGRHQLSAEDRYPLLFHFILVSTFARESAEATGQRRGQIDIGVPRLALHHSFIQPSRLFRLGSSWGRNDMAEEE